MFRSLLCTQGFAGVEMRTMRRNRNEHCGHACRISPNRYHSTLVIWQFMYAEEIRYKKPSRLRLSGSHSHSADDKLELLRSTSSKPRSTPSMVLSSPHRPQPRLIIALFPSHSSSPSSQAHLSYPSATSTHHAAIKTSPPHLRQETVPGYRPA
jgi:hypothetical protein